MQKGKKNGVYIQILCTLSLFLLFAICSLFLISISAANYKGMLGENDKNFSANASLRYVTNKLHAYDIQNGISVVNDKGITMLSLEDSAVDGDYHTLIYFYNGYLYEIMTKKDNTFKLGDGEQILKVKNFTFKISDKKTVILSADNSDKKHVSSVVKLKCAEFREEIANAGT